MKSINRFTATLMLTLFSVLFAPGAFATAAFVAAAFEHDTSSPLQDAALIVPADTANPACVAVAPAHAGQAVLDYVMPDTSLDTVAALDTLQSHDNTAAPDNRFATCIDCRIAFTGSRGHLSTRLKRGRLQALNVSKGFNFRAIRPG